MYEIGRKYYICLFFLFEINWKDKTEDDGNIYFKTD